MFTLAHSHTDTHADTEEFAKMDMASMDEFVLRNTFCRCIFVSVEDTDRKPIRRFSSLVSRQLTSDEDDIEVRRLESQSPDDRERWMIELYDVNFDSVCEWSTRQWLEAGSKFEARFFRLEDVVVEKVDESRFWLHIQLRCTVPLLENVDPVLICSRTAVDFVRWSKKKHLLFPVEFQKIVMAMYAAYRFGSLGILGHNLIEHVCSYLPMAWPTPCCGWFHDRQCRGGYVSSDGAHLECNLVLQKYPIREPLEPESCKEAVCRYHFDRGFFEPVYGEPLSRNHSFARPWYCSIEYRRWHYFWFSILWLSHEAYTDKDNEEDAVVADVVAEHVNSDERFFARGMLVSQTGTNRVGMVLDDITDEIDAVVNVGFYESETVNVRPGELVFVPPSSVGEEVFLRGARAVVLLIRMNQVIIQMIEGRTIIVPISKLCLIAKTWHKRLKI
jgi:hypothetical protein